MYETRQQETFKEKAQRPATQAVTGTTRDRIDHRGNKTLYETRHQETFKGNESTKRSTPRSWIQVLQEAVVPVIVEVP